MGDGSHLLKRVRRLAAGDDPSDAGLLRRFAAAADPEAFAELVRRHGPAVLGVCRRVLRNDSDADDAFQAAFLVLARRAGSVRSRQAVGGWLFGVARHVAVRLRDKNARRVRHERAAAAARSVGVGGPDADLRAAIDDELARLPEQERAAVLACLVRGQTQDQAAAELGLSLSTLRRRLDAGRERLRLRLARRLGEVPAGVLAGSAAAVPPTLAGVTVDGAVLFAAGVRTGTPAVLAMGELAMMRAKLAVLAGAVVAVAGLAAGGTAVWPSAQADDPKPAKAGSGAKPERTVEQRTADTAAEPESPAADDLIRPGERLKVSFQVGGELVELGELRGEPNGKIALGLQYGGRVKVAGLTVEGAEAALAAHMTKVRGVANAQAEVIRLDWGVFPSDRLQPSARADAGDVIKPGDRLRMELSGVAGVELKGEYQVEPNGKVPVGTFGRVTVAGLTVEEAEKAAREQLRNRVNNPDLLVTRAGPVADPEPAGGGKVKERVRKLEAEVAELKKQVAELRKK